MKPYERIAANAYPYFKLATWDARSLTFRDGKHARLTEGDARQDARQPGTYRVSVVTAAGRTDLEPFIIESPCHVPE